jgi:hypothetical protein
VVKIGVKKRRCEEREKCLNPGAFSVREKDIFLNKRFWKGKEKQAVNGHHADCHKRQSSAIHVCFVYATGWDKSDLPPEAWQYWFIVEMKIRDGFYDNECWHSQNKKGNDFIGVKVEFRLKQSNSYGEKQCPEQGEGVKLPERFCAMFVHSAQQTPFEVIK